MGGKLGSATTSVQLHLGEARQPFCARRLTAHQLSWRGTDLFFVCQLNQGMIRWQVERARVGSLARRPGNPNSAKRVMGSLMTTESQDLSLTSHQKDRTVACVSIYTVKSIIITYLWPYFVNG